MNRIDRVSAILVQLQSRSFVTAQHICRTQELEEVVIRLKKDKASIVDDDKYYHGLFSKKQTEDSVELSFLTFSIDKFAHWYLSFADVATIVKPAALKDKVRDILRNISI
jgi:predicted DNA-binding transcriptional regulator YafY